MTSFERRGAFAFATVSVFVLMLAGCGDDRVPMAACASAFERSCPSPTGGSACVPVTSDPNNCGGCGNRCAVGQLCRTSTCVAGPVMMDGSMPGVDLGPPGMCSPSCPSTQRCCGTTCMNRMVASGTDGRSDRSFMNCGGCGMACDAMTASACSGTACTCGTLGRPCAVGQICTNSGGGFTCQANCGTMGGPCAAGTMCCGTGDTAMCLNTQEDVLNCGTCGHACGGTEGCVAGVCTPLCGATPCAAGQLCCADTCVTPGPTDCGGCGVTCAPTDICGVRFIVGGICCGEETFPGTVLDCSPAFDAGVPVDAGASDAGADVDAGDVDAGDPDAG